MDIYLYHNRDDYKVLNKRLSDEKLISGVYLLETTDIIRPHFIFTTTDDSIFKQYNYLYCETFGRYYFIKGLQLLDGERYDIECEVDPLMSFKEDINNAEINVARSGWYTNPLVRDNTVKNSVQGIPQTKLLTGHEFIPLILQDNYSIIMTLLGGSI